MKIRHQLRAFIIGMIIIPIICSASVPLFLFILSPERVLMKGYKEIRKLENLEMENEDWEVLRRELLNVPPGVQTAIIAEHSTVLLSTIPNLKTGSTLEDSELLTFLRHTSRDYFYQVVTPKLKASVNFLIIHRTPKDMKKPPKAHLFIVPISMCLIIFELFCVITIILISNNISHSISLLEKATDRIASGDFDFDLSAEISHSHITNNEITSLAQNLNKMRLSLKEETERRTRFVMGISHDLRTPVALIKGYTEALADGVVSEPEEVKKSLEVIGVKTEQLETMIDALINFMKLDSTQWRQQLLPHDIVPIIKEFARTSEMTGTVYKRKITAKVSLPDSIKIPVDKMLFSRALENIFSNALRYTKDGDSISITAEQITTVENKKRVVITISDTGVGIEKEDLNHIFDLFYRGTNSRREQGMGIGLSVVKNIIDTHGWAIHVDSDRGVGTIFRIEIPL